jgi:hypothetical protein
VIKWSVLLTLAVILWIFEFRSELNDLGSEFVQPKGERKLRKSQPRDYFFCLKKDTGECTKNMIGEPECEFCQHYLVCKNCGKYNTKFCDKCTIAILKQSFDLSE